MQRSTFRRRRSARCSEAVADTAVYYARDGLGRHSLLVFCPSQNDKPTNTIWELASVACHSTKGGSWKEVEPGHVFCYNWRNGTTTSLPLSPFSLCGLFVPEFMEEASRHLQDSMAQAIERRLGDRHEQPCAILFSGGLDSVVLAALTIQILPWDHSIHLVNVSFVDQHQPNSSKNTASSMSADTQAALALFQELKKLYPHHCNLQLVTKQADWHDIVSVEPHIRNLIHPKTTVMDVNIATALWFPSAATTSNDRILLTGLGADEQMGGYGRHRKAWQKGGVAALRQELDLDLGRLWERNLGRDDRVLSDNAKEARLPYLDANVIEFLHRLDLELVCDFTFPAGQGDNRILRLVAERLGLTRHPVWKSNLTCQ